MPDELVEFLNKVEDEQTFLAFVRALAADRENEVEKESRFPSSPYGPGANGWESSTIESFLGAATAWAEDSHFGRDLIESEFNGNPWNQFAHFLYAGKIYE